MKSIEQSLQKIRHDRHINHAFSSSDSDNDVIQPLSIQFPQIIRALDSKALSPAKNQSPVKVSLSPERRSPLRAVKEHQASPIDSPAREKSSPVKNSYPSI